MKRVFALVLIALSTALAQAQPRTSEGRVADLSTAAPAENRTSKYAGSRSEDPNTQSKPATSSTTHQHKHVSGRTPAGKVSRSASQAPSARAPYFEIHDAGSVLITDRDGDEYHSEFRIRFDADTLLDDAWVYAELYVRRYGESEWVLYHVTDDFLIDGRDDDDDYYVTTTLDEGFATGDYDVAVDLYESDRSGVVATIGPSDSGALSLLPLEEIGLDVPIEIAGYSIRNVTTTLIADDDGDGHSSSFRITFDPDADFNGALAYVRVWVRGQGDSWIEEFVSEDFEVDVSGTADEYSIDVEWLNGYPTSYYDVQIDMYDSYTDLLAASAGSERPELSQIPLEDESRDLRPNPSVVAVVTTTTSSRESGGGALTVWWVLILGALAAGRAVRRL